MGLILLWLCRRSFCLHKHFNHNFSLPRTSTKRLLSSCNTLCREQKPKIPQFNNPYDNANKIDSESVSTFKKTDFESVSTGFLNDLTAKTALNALIMLRKLASDGDIDPSTFINEDKFMIICKTFDTDCKMVESKNLVMGLRCLLELGLSADSSIVQSIENEVLSRSRKMPLTMLCFCLEFHKKFQNSEQQISVVQNLISLLNKRWFEVSEPIHVIKLLQNKSLLDKSLISKVEDHALEFADRWSVEETISLFTVLFQQKLRPKPLMCAVSYHLIQKKEILTLRQCCDLFYTLNSLNFINHNLLNKLAQDCLLGLESTDKASLVSSLMTSLSLLKWDQPVLLEQCCQWFEKNHSLCKSRDYVSLVLSLAHLNYEPKNVDTLFPIVLDHLRLPPEGPQLSASSWVDVIWSLAVLGRATQYHLLYILQGNNFRAIIENTEPKSVKFKKRLQNIAAVAKVEFPSLTFPDLSGIEVEESAAVKEMNRSVIEAMENFLPQPEFLASNLNTTFGFRIVGEFIMNTKGDPVPVTEYGVKAAIHKELKPLLEDCKRVALLVWSYKDLKLISRRPIGANALAKRILTKLGYTVVQVPYTMFSNMKTTEKQVQYLQQHIRNRIIEKDQ